jgi:hypothetical protein
MKKRGWGLERPKGERTAEGRTDGRIRISPKFFQKFFLTNGVIKK